MTTFNLLRNGGFEIDQHYEGSPLNCNAGDTIAFADGWYGSHLSRRTSSAFRFDVQRRVNGPGEPHYSARITVTNPVSTLDPDDRFRIHTVTRPEDGKLVKYGRPDALITSLSFLVRSSHAGRYAHSLANHDGTRVMYHLFDVNTPHTWEYKEFHSLPPCVDGTWNHGLSEWWGYHVFTAAMGGNVTDPTAPEDTWMPAPFSPSKHHVGANDTLTNTGMCTKDFYFEIAEVMWTTTARAIPFIPSSDELLRCQTRYEKSYSRGVKPGTITPGFEGAIYMASNSPVMGLSQSFVCEKMVADTKKLKIYSPSTGALGKIWDMNGKRDIDVTWLISGTHGFSLAGKDFTAPQVGLAHFVYDDR